MTYKVFLSGFEDKHVAQYYLDLLKELGGTIYDQKLQLAVQSADDAWADDFLKKNGVSSQDRLVAVIPGAGASWGQQAVYRRWSIDKYVQLVDKIIEKHKVPIILMGDKNETGLCERFGQGVKNGSSIMDVCGQTTLGQMAALLSRCQVVVLNDGGPLHIAVASGVKTVSIFGPVDEQVYGPYPAQGHKVVTRDIPCRPCYRRFRRAQCEHISCLRNIEVDDVLERVEELL